MLAGGHLSIGSDSLQAKAVAGSQSIYRAIAILRGVAEHNQTGITATRLGEKIGLTLGTTHRLLKVLASENMLTMDPYSKRYHLGLDLFVLGSEAYDFRVCDLVDSRLSRLRDLTGDTVFLLIRSGTDSLCLSRLEGNYPIRALTLTRGSRRPLGIGAGGIALLASQPKAIADKILQNNASLYHDHFGVEVSDIRKWIERARRRGFSFNDGTLKDGVQAVGLAIGPREGPPWAAVSIATSDRRMANSRRKKLEQILESELDDIDWSLLASDRNFIPERRIEP